MLDFNPNLNGKRNPTDSAEGTKIKIKNGNLDLVRCGLAPLTS